ncbi:hypothetical protein [Legionella sp.]|uniref:hypothetical protein n=1 Tax=Legionella sp. TaxID=459 RepID=UPI003C972A63
MDIDKEIYTNIQEYCSWAGIDEINHFFEEAATLISSKDKDWKKHKRATSIIKK